MHRPVLVTAPTVLPVSVADVKKRFASIALTMMI